MARSSAPTLDPTPVDGPVIPRGTAATLVDLPIGLVDVGANVRGDPGELDELTASIKEHGVLQLVRATGPVDGRYLLTMGQRRFLAARKAGLGAIPAVVTAVPLEHSKGRRAIEQLVENLQRADLNPIDEANALRAALDADPKLTQASLAQELGKSAPWVANALRLLEVAAPVQAMVARGQLTSSHAKAIAGAPVKAQRELADYAIQRGLSAHGLEEHVRANREQAERESAWKAERDAAEKKTRKAVVDAAVAKVPKGAKRPDAWSELVELPEPERRTELAKFLAKGFADRFNVKLDWAAIAAEVGVVVEPEAPKSARTRKKAEEPAEAEAPV